MAESCGRRPFYGPLAAGSLRASPRGPRRRVDLITRSEPFSRGAESVNDSAPSLSQPLVPLRSWTRCRMTRHRSPGHARRTSSAKQKRTQRHRLAQARRQRALQALMAPRLRQARCAATGNDAGTINRAHQGTADERHPALTRFLTRAESVLLPRLRSFHFALPRDRTRPRHVVGAERPAAPGG